jgi:hypothetical protein
MLLLHVVMTTMELMIFTGKFEKVDIPVQVVGAKKDEPKEITRKIFRARVFTTNPISHCERSACSPDQPAAGADRSGARD